MDWREPDLKMKVEETMTVGPHALVTSGGQPEEAAGSGRVYLDGFKRVLPTGGDATAHVCEQAIPLHERRP